MRPSAGFLLRFFAFAAGLFALWSFGGLGDLYARAVLLVSDPLMWLLSGFQVSQIIPTGSGVDVMIRRGADEGLMPLQPREMFSGVDSLSRPGGRVHRADVAPAPARRSGSAWQSCSSSTWAWRWWART